MDTTYVTTNEKFTQKNIIAIFAIAVTIIGFIINVFASDGKTPLQMCQESYMKATNAIVQYNTENPKYKISLPSYDCSFPGTSTGGIAPVPEHTLRTRFGLDYCRFINEVHKLPKYNLDWTAYDIACEVGKSFDVKSPGDYTIQAKGFGYNIGDFIILQSIKDKDVRIVLGHTATSRKKGDVLKEGDIIGQTNLSGESTGIHVHIELWYKYFNVGRGFALGEEYSSINGTALLNHRHWNFSQPSEVFYFTSYDLGDEKQNDSSPCIGASGKDLCSLERSGIRTMALTSDIREKLGIKFGDKVVLEGDEGCDGTYQVEDEMNARFRTTPGILRPNTPYYIKGDLPSKGGGACSIRKL